MNNSIHTMYNTSIFAKHSYCIKQQVGTCLFINNMHFYGYNDAPFAKEIAQCPRVVNGYEFGVGYRLCKEVCGQKYHAETMAINHFKTYINEMYSIDLLSEDPILFLKECKDKGIKIDGPKWMYIFGHDRPCEHCTKIMKDLGISHILLCKNKEDIFHDDRWKIIRLDN
uniref:Putative CMP/dCMP deaminase zinc-binding n=1 Tax=viral metagenome TaxID=1070528 RepID=A0A6M3KC16_9ZZZZ